MKTAIKKVFSLMLVAVLLVGMMPFQVFANGGTAILRVFIGDEFTDKSIDSGNYSANSILQKGYSGEVEAYVLTVGYGGDNVAGQEDVYVPADQYILLYVTPKAHSHTPGAAATCTTAQTCTGCGETLTAALGHTEGAAATCTTAQTCTVCSDTLVAALGHTESTAATCTADQTCTVCGDTLVAALGHKVVDGACTRCDYTEPQVPTTATVEIIINNVGTGKSFTIGAGKSVADVYEAFLNSPHAEAYEGAEGPIVTLADSSNQIGTTEGGMTYWLWLSWTETPAAPNPTNAICATCGGDLDNSTNRMCEGCYWHEDDCTCNDPAVPENHKGQIKITVKFNNGDADITVWVNKGNKMRDIIAQIPMTTAASYEASWFWDSSFRRAVDLDARVRSEDSLTIYAKLTPIKDGPVNELSVKLNLNYDRKMGETLMAANNARMGDVLKNVKTPTRWGYEFAGWYWDANCRNDVDRNDKVNDHVNRDKIATIYAKWERKHHNDHEAMLKIYLNGDSNSSVKILDLHDYAKDGVISYSEVAKEVNKYYTAKSSSDDMDIDGLFTFDTWNHGKYSMKNAEKGIRVNEDDDTVIYVMVRDAKARSSSSATADASNPKTGDMIMNSVMVMGASVSALAVLFYLNKKRVIK